MKKLITLAVAVTLGFATLALAGDDPVQTVAYTGTQGCTTALRPKVNYAIQCTTDCYVRMQEANTADAGISVSAGNSVSVPAGKLYDTPTTASQVYICVVQSSASGTMKVFVYRSRTE